MMKQIYRSLWFASVCFLLAGLSTAHAQKQTITGKITDETGTPIPGVNVLVKGTSYGTTANIDGGFTLEAAPTDVLVISFIGYKTQEVPVGNQTQISVTISEDLTTLDEIVVVGYGEQKKALNTGANLHVKGDDLQKMSTTNALQALQGQAPGVQISSTSGQPGEPMRVVIRGVGTVGAPGPLYVVDGVLTTDISYLNNADIESIDVLKDAASAAIYGSQAANGVVLITTKSGRGKTQPQLTFDAFYGVQNTYRDAQLLNAREYMTIMNESAVNSGKALHFTNEEIDATSALLGGGTDWVDAMSVKNAKTQNYSLGLTGGSENSIYSTSISYQSQEGIMGGKDLSYYERYNFRINTEHKLFKDIVTLGQNLTFAYVNDRGLKVGNQYNNSLRAAFNVSPLLPVYDADGNYTVTTTDDWTGGSEANPYAEMVYTNQNRGNNQKLLGNVYLQVEPIKGLKFRTSIGIDYFSDESRSFLPEYKLSTYSLNNLAKADQYMGKGRTVIWDNLVSYGFNLNTDHRFDVMAGTSAYMYDRSGLWASNTGLVFFDIDHGWLDNAINRNGTTITVGGGPTDRPYSAEGPKVYNERRLSYFGRLNYNYKETYLLNATLRADGSSKFATSNQWGYFPSVSAGWLLTNEAFLADQNLFQVLKLRASWGQVGSQNTVAYQYMSPVIFSRTNYIFGSVEGANGLVPGAYPGRLGNPDLKWETSEQVDIGFDAQLVGGKLSVSADWYKKTTKDWLIVAPILATAGGDAPYINGGDVKNTGIELAVAYNNSLGDLKYTVSVNGAYNKNRVGRIPTQDGIIHGGTNQLYNNALEFYRAENGHPIGYFWGLKTNGIFQTAEEVAAYRSSEGTVIQPTAQAGDVKYVDRDDNGVINDQDRTELGSPLPDFTFGFNVSAAYKGFDLTIQANGVAGNQIVQAYRNQASQFANYTTAILDRWHGAGTSNEMPRVTDDNRNWIQFSDLYIQDGDFLRISNVTLGYDLSTLLKRKYVNQVRVYASALNLMTFTKYDGMDPEIGYGIDNGERDKFSSGIDLGYYPRPRTFMVGVNVKF
ncbi:SusC/RagA family TonB-linked outer membrane protein [Parachryseolinea silvisoli]|uniref:SusC/RagA family TonB-linked outer membrane protein n=1 Tax=Parachryseolinea silvisoli TaxID=2873601 RepID=UPI002265E89E|nr:TonB-dependent receptor [Parachryseolinea silvisoli]MCD9015672.1 TonB-dependent receptor [Parachryseolinea silvisoli]